MGRHSSLVSLLFTRYIHQTAINDLVSSCPYSKKHHQLSLSREVKYWTSPRELPLHERGKPVRKTSTLASSPLLVFIGTPWWGLYVSSWIPWQRFVWKLLETGQVFILKDCEAMEVRKNQLLAMSTHRSWALEKTRENFKSRILLSWAFSSFCA